MDFTDSLILLAIVGPLAATWAFAIVDVFHRPDLSGGWQATWLAIVVLVPFFGTVMYLVARPRKVHSHAPRGLPDDDGRAEQLRVLDDLHERGKLTDDELVQEQAMLTSSLAGWGARTPARPATTTAPPSA